LIPTNVTELCLYNAQLDAELFSEIDATDPEALNAAPAPGEWCLAELYAHLGEFPSFFAEQLRQWLADAETQIGREIDHPGRLAAIADSERSLAALAVSVRSAFNDMAEALELLKDSDIVASTNNVKYGSEPMIQFLDRYLVGHKAAHLEQVRTTKRMLDAKSSARRAKS
jgi:hypothetical protein